MIPNAIVGLDCSDPDPIRNLAWDEALLEHAEEHGVSAVRIWRQVRYAVILGASCRLRESVDVEACRRDGIAIARRSSGGGTVLIGPGVLNAAVVWPIAVAPELRAVDIAQKWMLERVARELRTNRPGTGVEVLGSGDLTLGGRKCAGRAQRRLRRYFLVHASVLVDFDIGRIGRYLKSPLKQPEYRRNRSHHEFLTNLDATEAELIQAVRRAWLGDGEFRNEPLISSERIDAIIARRLGDSAWIERF